MNDYSLLCNLIDSTKLSCDSFEYGKSRLGFPLIAFHKGSYFNKQILITGGIHAREYISSFLVLYLCENYNDDVGIYFVPLLNPDGVKICTNGIDFISDECLKKFLFRINNFCNDFSQWKSNARGVDLNVNFDAGFSKSNLVCFTPQKSGYSGEKFESENETLSLVNFIKNKNIFCSISYHTKGEVVYYGYKELNKKQFKNAKNYAKMVSKCIKFKKIRSKNSSGGLSDYLSFRQNILSVTVELGKDSLIHPIKYDHFFEIKKRQEKLLKRLVKFVKCC